MTLEVQGPEQYICPFNFFEVGDIKSSQTSSWENTKNISIPGYPSNPEHLFVLRFYGPVNPMGSC